MLPSVGTEDPSLPLSLDSYDALRNSNFITENTHVMNLIRKHQRPKISPLLPNPAYLPAFYQYLSHYSYVNQKSVSQKLHQPARKVSVQQIYKRHHQVDVPCPQVLNRKSSTSTSPFDFDSHTTKTNLLQRITKIDDKIAEIEFELEERKKIEAAKKKHHIKKLKQVLQPGSHSVFRNIISENQRKAHESHCILLSLDSKPDFPLYNQPCDTTVYHRNKEHFISFRENLKMFMRKKCVRRVKTQKSLLRLYSHLACKWKNNINKVENSRRHQSKEAKKRNYFETVFPELQKKKLTGERSKRTGDHVLSEADFQEILRKLQFENLEYTLLKSSSVHPPPLLDTEQRSKVFLNQNNLIADAKGTGDKEFYNLWTSIEKEIFKEKFIQYSKNFGQIASFLNKKSVADCVRYYYLTKKRENYKIAGKSKKSTAHDITDILCS